MDYDILKDLLDGFLGEPHKYDDSNGQIGYDCPVCSYEIKGLDKGDGKGNLEVSLEKNVYHCWSCGETHGTHGHLGKLIDKFGSKKEKLYITNISYDKRKIRLFKT